ncbi:MAG: lipoprotein LpqH [Mycobacterium sp.]
MTRRLGALAGAVSLGVAIVGCSSSQQLSTPEARVVINGQGDNYQVTCLQSGRAWTIETLDEEPGFTATVDTGDAVTAEAVDIRNIGGFTGTFWKDNIGEADAELGQGTFSISGEGEGSFADKPNHRVSATFDITANC